jgi:hypothetical protein
MRHIKAALRSAVAARQASERAGAGIRHEPYSDAMHKS